MRKAKLPLALLLVILVCTCAPSPKLSAQTTPGRPLTVEDMQAWLRIRQTQISPDGRFVLYTLTPDVGDPTAVLYDAAEKREKRWPRLHDAKLNYAGTHLIGLLKPTRDTVRSVKLNAKKPKEKLAEMDSLLVYDLRAGTRRLHPTVYAFKTGERWSDAYAYTTKTTLPDSLAKSLDKDGKRLVVRNFTTPDSFYLESVKSYALARDEPVLLAHQLRKDSTWSSGVFRLDTRELRWNPISENAGAYAGLALRNDGSAAAFLSASVEDNAQKPWQLHYHAAGGDTARVLNYAPPQTEGEWRISDDYTPRFHATENYLFFGTTPRRPERDTTLLDEEIADVEVWRTADQRLYTQQNIRLKDDEKRTYLTAWDPARDRFISVASPERPYVDIPERGHYVLTYDDEPYAKSTTWEGFPGARNSTVVDLATGRRVPLQDGRVTPAEWTADGQYLTWYDQTDTTWYGFDPAVALGRRSAGASVDVSRTRRDATVDEPRQRRGAVVELASSANGVFYDERNDRPMHPRSYGLAGTIAPTDGGGVLLYDRYDIWRADPSGQRPLQRLTRGREARTVYRLVDLDPEDDFIRLDEPLLATMFFEDDHHSAIAKLALPDGTYEKIVEGPYTFDGFLQARENSAALFTRSDFREFPDLWYTKSFGGGADKISDANPQQDDFAWGTSELYEWIDPQGRTLRGILVKPDGFDPTKQYPMMVNFYERSSEGVFRHRTPVPGRSSINYAHYVSKGYVIFNPDVVYRVGYPGESAYDCVMSGVTSLIAKGFVDRERIGLQGHSWGGYQAAYIATKTDLFAAIESGAPVVNMFSAYGGIRWRSGLSRQFQYERTQSRIGGSPWEYPLRYLENSPIFTTDKINTPILILHNDKDGAVPWYQGIEWYTALRRLDKQAWLLNYRGEPHWPVKWANRADFQRRMEAFFDHYLLGAEMPRWMEEGVSALERGKSGG